MTKNLLDEHRKILHKQHAEYHGYEESPTCGEENCSFQAKINELNEIDEILKDNYVKKSEIDKVIETTFKVWIKNYHEYVYDDIYDGASGLKKMMLQKLRDGE
jgi:hypothetical protein